MLAIHYNHFDNMSRPFFNFFQIKKCDNFSQRRFVTLYVYVAASHLPQCFSRLCSRTVENSSLDCFPPSGRAASASLAKLTLRIRSCSLSAEARNGLEKHLAVREAGKNYHIMAAERRERIITLWRPRGYILVFSLIKYFLS